MNSAFCVTTPYEATVFDAPSWKSIVALCDEILTSEIVTRLWTAIVALHDKHHRQKESEPIVRSVMLGHMEARHRVMTLILNYHGVGPQESVMLNRLRLPLRALERYSAWPAIHLVVMWRTTLTTLPGHKNSPRIGRIRHASIPLHKPEPVC